MSKELPFGDPCRGCGAASVHEDPRDRICMCEPCAACGDPTLSTCAYCGRSLGCVEHAVTIERHVATYCLASEQQRVEIESLSANPGPWDLRRAEIERVRQALRDAHPLPWPNPVSPFDDSERRKAYRRAWQEDLAR